MVVARHDEFKFPKLLTPIVGALAAAVTRIIAPAAEVDPRFLTPIVGALAAAVTRIIAPAAEVDPRFLTIVNAPAAGVDLPRLLAEFTGANRSADRASPTRGKSIKSHPR